MRDWLELLQPPGELEVWAQPLLDLEACAKSCVGGELLGPVTPDTVILLAKPLLISRCSDTWLGLSPLHPLPCPKSSPESFLRVGLGGAVPSAPLAQGNGDRGQGHQHHQQHSHSSIPRALPWLFPSPCAALHRHQVVPAVLAQPFLGSLTWLVAQCASEGGCGDTLSALGSLL